MGNFSRQYRQQAMKPARAMRSMADDIFRIIVSHRNIIGNIVSSTSDREHIVSPKSVILTSVFQVGDGDFETLKNLLS